MSRVKKIPLIWDFYHQLFDVDGTEYTYDGMCDGGKPTKSKRRVANLKGL
jgi:hypothetical protein